MLRPRRYPLLLRLALIEGDVAEVRKLLGWLVEDLMAAQTTLRDTEARVMVVVGVVGAVAMATGASGQAVGDLIMSLSPGGNLEDADETGTAVVQEVMLANTEPEGEG